MRDVIGCLLIFYVGGHLVAGGWSLLLCFFSALKIWCQTRTRRAHRAQSLTHRPSFNGSERPRARDALIESIDSALSRKNRSKH
jgi:hypothetical protein